METRWESERRVYMSVQERHDLGRARRSVLPRSALADFSANGNGRDPVALLEAQASSRVAELVPIRYGRMLASPFAFFRGRDATHCVKVFEEREV